MAVFVPMVKLIRIYEFEIIEGMRSRRRQDEQRMKDRAHRVSRLWYKGLHDKNVSAREVGRMASTHCRPCSCWVCTGHKEFAPMRERRFEGVRLT
jgi:hypothetical protein